MLGDVPADCMQNNEYHFKPRTFHYHQQAVLSTPPRYTNRLFASISSLVLGTTTTHDDGTAATGS